jgi:hypothetical protein
MKLILSNIIICLSMFDGVLGQTIFWDNLVPDSKSNRVTHRIILIGDAGEPAKDIREPVFIALEEHASFKPDSTLIVFLGDNIYPNGMPNEKHPDRGEYERRLDEQIHSIVNSGAHGIFIPGNHDWRQGNAGGWERIINQAEHIYNSGYKSISFYPMNGCPGPSVIDFSSKIRLIILDTQWWFQDRGMRPEESDSLCNQCTNQTVVTALNSILSKSTDKQVVIAAHHPLKTYGPHAGYFGWKDHIFPLRKLNDILWIPLPIIGSLYPLIRGSGVSNQDLTSDEYQQMKNLLESILHQHSGIVFASGHEHALQILEGVNNNVYVVSGSSIWGHVEESLSEGDDTIFAGKHEGFVILDYLFNGRTKLSVIKVLNEAGDSKSVFSMWLNSEY